MAKIHWAFYGYTYMLGLSLTAMVKNSHGNYILIFKNIKAHFIVYLISTHKLCLEL